VKRKLLAAIVGFVTAFCLGWVVRDFRLFLEGDWKR
jgi:hypothetical protein